MTQYKLNLTEEELVARLKQKDKAAFASLYDNYSGALFGIILKIVRTDPPAEDVLQESFLKIWNKIDSYSQDKGSIFTWMLNVSRNTGIDTIRSEAYKKSATTYDISVNTRAIEANFNTHLKTEHVGIKEIVDKLKPEHKELIDLLYFGGLTQAEVAEQLNMPLGTVKTKVKQAMTHLREIFKD